MERQSRLLVVDDDEGILEITQRSLEAEGYRVDTAHDGERALELVRASAADLLVLDVMLPGRDGFEVCREIRKFSNLPIILLTAKSDTVDVVVGLESGADDYVAKPFQMRELVARIRSLLRRTRERGDEKATFVGAMEVRPDEGVVLKHGKAVDLTRTEFHLLCALAGRPGRIFSREVLLQQVWGYDYFGDVRLVDVHIRRLRAKVEDDPANPTLIHTVRGMGYKLAEGG
ncbi:MAG: response regulator [Actinomycetota bacterium]